MEFACLDLVNSDWPGLALHDDPPDHLADPAWVAELLDRWDLGLGSPMPEAGVAALGALRALLHTMVRRLVAGEAPTDQEIRELAAFLALGPAVADIGRQDGAFLLQRTPVRRNWAWAVAEFAASFAELLARNEPARLKVCENPECRWVFWDDSRNRSRRWCEAATCGNLMKVRRYRARRRAAGPS